MSAYLSALAICGAALVIGAALCSAKGSWSWTSPAAGMAAVMLLALVAIRLPGHGATAAVALALAVAAAALRLARRRVDLRPLAEGLPVAAVVLAFCSLAFVANDRIGELGQYILDDLAGHMAQADAMRTVGADAGYTPSGYPIGPHSLVAALASGLGLGVSAGFTGLLLAAPALTAMTALGALPRARWYLRMPAAALAGVSYMAVSYVAEGAFKEPLLGLFFLGFVLALRERRPLALVLTAAGGVAVFGVSALVWPAAALAWLAALELIHGWRPDLERWRPRRPWLTVGVAAVVLAGGVALLAGTSDFFEEGPGQYLSHKGTGGNFLGQLSPLEGLGVWRQADFRLGVADPLLEPGILLALGVALFGLVWFWRRREWTLLAGALGAISVYAVARPFTLAYFSGKALAVAAPLVTLLGAGALAMVASRVRPGAVAVLAAALLAAYVAVAGAASALVLRGAHVRPHERGTDLAALRAQVDGESTVYLGRDNYARWELRGAELAGFQSYNSPLARELTPIAAKATGAAGPPAVDADSVDPALLESTRYLIAPRTPYASAQPAGFRLARRTRWHELWERRGTFQPRAVLPAEGEAPGAVLDCATPEGRVLSRTPGVAFVRPPPVVGPAEQWRIPEALNGQTRTQVLDLGPGVWDISLRWFSDVPLRLRAGSLDVTLPAYLADSATFASAGRVRGGGPLRVTVEVPDRRRLAVERTARLGTVVATRVDRSGRLVPLARACGAYVDWYRAG